MHHPLLYDELMRKFAKAGIDLHISDFVQAPSEMQFLVKERIGFGLLRDRVPLDAELTRRRIEGLQLRIKTAFVCHPAQQRTVLPLLAYRLSKLCTDMQEMPGAKLPIGRVIERDLRQLRMFG
jgi:hypothetical protein